ncbi:MAG: sulfotransferase family 2 domain-containing protein [Candidatus Nanopelagicales bacterium]
MLVLHRHRLILLEPWKSASSTTRHRLGELNGFHRDHAVWFEPEVGRVISNHLTQHDLARLPEGALGYDVAVFIRNPYDRVVSAFRQVHRDLARQGNHDFGDRLVNRSSELQLAATRDLLHRSGGNLNRWVALLDRRCVDVPGHNPNLPLHPAHYWTHRDGVRKASVIGRVEDFETDFADLCRRYSLPSRSGNRNVDSDPRPGIRHAALLSTESLQRIEEWFAADLDLFGYPRLSERGQPGLLSPVPGPPGGRRPDTPDRPLRPEVLHPARR